MTSLPRYKSYQNADFYNPDGKFISDTGKKAYYEMMEFFKYPIPDRLRGEDFWAKDFNIGKFTESGLGGIFWISSPEYNISGHEMFLLPNQCVPEHYHVATENTPAKLEAWHVRHGWVYIYSEGEPTPGAEERVPSSHRDCTLAKSELIVNAGEVGTLANPTERHWMRAGSEGAIVTEYASHHDHDGLRFSHPDGKFFTVDLND
jgi:D-lyxose ketol-isomerase